ncbi:hypothetical protein QA641_12610 [Bradyrhizobium sp. CB1650]|uniref:hypothetical protein n=1 Tax=Bradyrhizobium sp. CB1650 TaxID=3039153 RepID=UPI002434DD21|nr:hypothetical protein [Bradyrhizobium sp. CB1650]WGD54669.1 hypothetical protein QA641_12610 [Bradyrhizobium sp. CB1650]
MRPTKVLLSLAFFAAAATALPDTADARRMGGEGVRAAHFHGGGVRPGWHGGGTRWHAGGGARWAGGRYYRGGYYGRGWGYPGAAAAGLATGAALGAATAYGSSYGSCYQTQSVWNGYTYVQRTVNVC